MSFGNSIKYLVGGAALITYLMATPAVADYDDHPQTGNNFNASLDDGPYTDWARVVRVEPLHRTVRVSTPRQECWDEPVKRYRTQGYGHGQGRHAGSYTPLIIGGILGGVLGNQFGKGSGRTIMTAAGALLGGSVASDAQRHHRQHHQRAARETYTTYEQRCETTHSYHDETQPDGYLVDYEYNGRVYSTRTRRHPGDRIRVTVSVSPQG